MENAVLNSHIDVQTLDISSNTLRTFYAMHASRRLNVDVMQSNISFYDFCSF